MAITPELRQWVGGRIFLPTFDELGSALTGRGAILVVRFPAGDHSFLVVRREDDGQGAQAPFGRVIAQFPYGSSIGDYTERAAYGQALHRMALEARDSWPEVAL